MIKMDEFKKKALEYNEKGKVSVHSLKKIETQEDLSLAYTPGVAEVCEEIEKDPELAYKYTSKWNTVAILTDGSAVLGLGDIGPLASIPVMEGKAVLFKRFADIDAWPVPLDNVRGEDENTDINKFIDMAKAIAPQYGGINMEDVAGPACFEIENRLKKELSIPVFHDDQHGTAIVTLAAIKNYLLITDKKIDKIRIVIMGAGAAGLSIASLLRLSGAKDILVCDSKGVIHSGRHDLNKWKQKHIIETDARTPEDAFKGADIFIGVSKPGIVTKEMIASMAKDPAVFPMSNPVPEISPKDIKEARDDAIIATGRSDYPNQINNVLIFPFIFRGTLDTRASDINNEMKMAAADALAELARKDVQEDVLNSYGLDSLEFSKDYIIPKPFDRRVFIEVSMAVAKAAIDSGVAQKEIDLIKYEKELRSK